LPGGLVARTQRPRRAKHGAPTQVRLQQAPNRAAVQRPAEPSRQALPTANQAAPAQEPQAPQKTRELGRQQTRRNPHALVKLTRIRSPGRRCPCGAKSSRLTPYVFSV